MKFGTEKKFDIFIQFGIISIDQNKNCEVPWSYEVNIDEFQDLDLK